jgi:hypothetical protein
MIDSTTSEVGTPHTNQHTIVCSQGNLVVGSDGRLEGDIDGMGSVLIDGKVVGNITADTVCLRNQVTLILCIMLRDVCFTYYYDFIVTLFCCTILSYTCCYATLRCSVPHSCIYMQCIHVCDVCNACMYMYMYACAGLCIREHHLQVHRGGPGGDCGGGG